MGKYAIVTLLLVALSAAGFGYAGQSPGSKPSGEERFLGTWAGTWDGAGTGKIEITITKEGGKPAGKVVVTTDGGDYTAKFKSLSFEASQMTAKYDFPLDENSEVLLKATFEGSAVSGTWSLRPKGEGNEVAGGAWTATKK